jgi:small subunit ribosomal protein S2
MAGTHFGHLTRRWNPKMRNYIFMSKQGIHIIDLKKTQEAVEKACDALAKIAANGESILFIGTKKQAKDIIRSEALRCNSPFVNERWLGGTLTNFATIRRSVKTMENLEKKATDGTYELISKKERLYIEKERAKLEKILGGIRNMKKLPGAAFIVDTRMENIAVNEARKLGIPIFAIIDTNANPDIIEYPIPANDDSFKSVGLITRIITDAILEGQKVVMELHPPKPEAPASAEKEDRRPRHRRRGGRGRGGGNRDYREHRDNREHREARGARDNREPRKEKA